MYVLSAVGPGETPVFFIILSSKQIKLCLEWILLMPDKMEL